MMLRFWFRCILLLGLFQGILPDLKNFEHIDSSENEKIELNVKVGSVIKLLSSIEADKQDIITLYKRRHDQTVRIVAEWKSNEKPYITEEYVGKIFTNETGKFMRGVDQADVGEYFFKYNITIKGKVVVLNVLESTQEKQIPKYLSDEEYMKILKGLQEPNLFIIITNIVVMIAGALYIIFHVKSLCSGQCRKTPDSMPRDLTLVPVEGDPSSVTLNWQPPQNPNGRITGYIVFHTIGSSLDDGNWEVEGVPGDKLSRTIRDLTEDTTYYFRVQAMYKMESGSISSTVHYKIPKEEAVPLLAVAREQPADSTVVDMHEEQAEHSTAVKSKVQIHAPRPSQQDADSIHSKLSASIVPLFPRDESTDPTPTTAEILTEEQVFQYLNSHPEFLIKYEKLKSAKGTISF